MSDWEDLERYPVTKNSDPTVTSLLKAISAQETVQIIYNGGSNPGANRIIHPHAVFTVEGSGYYYLEAYCHTRQEVRCFRVDKIAIPKGPVDWSQQHKAIKNDFEQTILNAIKAIPGQKAKDIAAQLGIERETVNSALYGRLRGEVRQDKHYRWYPKSAFVTDNLEPEHKRLETPLARLCSYYLDCLSYDDLGGVSTFAASKHGDIDYVELATLPFVDEASTDPFNSDEGRQLLGMIRRDRHRKTIFLGYPVRLNFTRSRRTKWEGFLVEPLLLFPFQETANKYGTPTLTDNLPQINFHALQSLSNVGKANLMEEAIQLANELGLDVAGDDQPDIDELIARLREIRPEWDWREDIDPYTLSKEPSLSCANKQGIYNRAILIAAERSPYTRGLETELGRLQLVEESTYGDTVLGSWLSGEKIESPLPEQQPLLEVLPLNSEQRQAVRQALVNPLTVVTGPPGTGKSQVVMSILINAAAQGKTVLFASKNNKAVDVVETRVNALGPRPVLLRLGRSEYQSKLAEYLVSLLASTTTPDDEANFQEYKTIHSKIQKQFESLDAQIEALIKLRNEVDQLEQSVESIRGVFGKSVFCQLQKVNCNRLEEATNRIVQAIHQSDRRRQNFLMRIFWPLYKKELLRQLSAEAENFAKIGRGIGLPVPSIESNSVSASQWDQYAENITRRVSEISSVKRYFSKLQTLGKARPLEELSKERINLTRDLAANSENLWRLWLRMQPARMTQEQRKILGDYTALLQMIVSANAQNQHLGRDVFRRYYELFPKITSIMSCWAVTSLSARGRVPFEPCFFDLLVIDEASQCDIASALPLLFRARRAVIIGDPKQLRHISTLPEKQDLQLLNKHGLLDEYPSWAYSTRSLFHLASSLCRGEDIVSLRDHHRSHSDIIAFSNKHFYEGRLRMATNYERLVRPRESEPAVRWVDVRGRAVRPSTGGAVNELEARAVVGEIERLLDQGYKGTIGVVSPFRAHANRIRSLVHNHAGLVSRITDMDFLANTVDKFQGDERDIVIFSPAVSAGITDSALGFLRKDPNRFNVAITRARAALIVVGDKAAAMNSGVNDLAKFAAYVSQVGKEIPQKQQRNASPPTPDYPPVSHPERVSDWERVFYRALYKAGIRAIPQYDEEKYDLDFAIIKGDRRLNIEIDGERYHRNWDGELCRRDQIRNQRLMELGWDVMRFWVYQVRDDLWHCIKRVLWWIKNDS